MASKRLGSMSRGLHRQRHVDGHDHRRPLARHPHLGARHGQRDDERGQAERDDPEREVPPPAGALGHDRAEQRHVGEPRGVRLAAQLQDHVDGDQRGDGQQREQPQRGLEGHRDAPPAAGTAAVGDESHDVHEPVPVGAQLQVTGPGPAQRRRRSRPAGRRPPRRTGCGTRRCPSGTSRVWPLSGSTTVSSPTSGSSSSRGSSTSIASSSWRADSAAQRPLPVAVAQEVGDDDDEAPAAGRPPQRLQRGGEVAAAPAGRPRGGDDRAQQPLGGQPARASPGSGRPAPPW